MKRLHPLISLPTPTFHQHTTMSKRELRKLLSEAADLGKKAERSLDTTDAFQSFHDKCTHNKTVPKFLRDLEALGQHATQVIEILEKAKEKAQDKEDEEEEKPKKGKAVATATATQGTPVPEFNSMDFLASFAGKAIAAAFYQAPNPPQKGGAAAGNPKKKKAIPAALRKQVWNHYIGGPIGETKCPVCHINTIDKLGFEAGHVVPECAGGSTTLHNLRPICGDCNRSMGALNMQEYALRYYGHSV